MDLLLDSPFYSSDLLFLRCPSNKESMGISCRLFAVQAKSLPSLNLHISPIGGRCI